MMHILIAPNAFKNSLSASAAAKAIQKGLQQSGLACTSECFPVGDGGDGTAAVLIEHLQGTIVDAEVHDPLKRKFSATFGLIDKNKTAVIELADASGLRLLKPHELAPLRTTTFGTGELIKAAVDKGARKIILGIGGSATVDGATGILLALGVRFLDATGEGLSQVPSDLLSLKGIDLSLLDQRILQCELIVLCDVENKLLGEEGAAAVFGPQKGATATDVQQLEAALTNLRSVVFEETGKDMASVKHGGAAGGVAAGLYALLNAKLVKGIDYFLNATGFDDALKKADVVITGEGSLDLQTLSGKAPLGVAERAKRIGIPVISLAGKVPLAATALHNYFDVVLPISHAPVATEEAMLHTEENLQRTARALGDLLAISALLKA